MFIFNKLFFLIAMLSDRDPYSYKLGNLSSEQLALYDVIDPSIPKQSNTSQLRFAIIKLFARPNFGAPVLLELRVTSIVGGIVSPRLSNNY
jgi:hypothetical protein